ncbi:MAG: hypothetical protein IKY43_07600 [Bacteroidales bacterium]|nr:hypothetical protein [Bacteroidales bacterium]
MNIKIERRIDNGKVIDGFLTINAEKICDCAENSAHALAPGRYNIYMHRCGQLGRRMPMVNFDDDDYKQVECDECCECHPLEYVDKNTNLPCYCPMFSAGNGAYSRKDGSILVGEYVAPGCLIHTQKHFDALFDRIRATLKRGAKVTLTVLESSNFKCRSW